MNEYLWSAFSGWGAVILFGSALAIPFLLRGQTRTKTPGLRRMWTHYWLGYATFFVSFAHSWLAMRSGKMAGVDIPGVWIATVALLVILWQLGVGLMLKDPGQSSRHALKRTHFWTMVLAAALIVTHIVRNMR